MEEHIGGARHTPNPTLATAMVGLYVRVSLARTFFRAFYSVRERDNV